jgi:hypothetical protein
MVRVISMKPDLARVATLALAFMVFTPSAQIINGAVYQTNDCESSQVLPFLPLSYGRPSCDGHCYSVEETTYLFSASINETEGDMSCYFWNLVGCPANLPYTYVTGGFTCKNFPYYMHSYKCYVTACLEPSPAALPVG